MQKVKIVADSACDLSSDIIEKYGITIIPLHVLLGDDSFFDGVDIKPDDLYGYVDKTGVLPKTAAVSPGEFIDAFKKLTEEGFDVVCIPISSGFSGTYQNAVIAASEVEGVTVVDSRNLSSGIGLLVVEAAIMAQNGASAAEIKEALVPMVDRVDASFIINSLDFLVKGGRCSAAAAFGANLLKLRPCINVVDGKMGVGKKYRGGMGDVFVTYAKERLDGISVKKDRVFVTHSKCDPALVTRVVDEVKSLGLFDEVIDQTAGCSITSHCGPDCLGVLFIREA